MRTPGTLVASNITRSHGSMPVLARRLARRAPARPHRRARAERDRQVDSAAHPGRARARGLRLRVAHAAVVDHRLPPAGALGGFGRDSAGVPGSAGHRGGVAARGRLPGGGDRRGARAAARRALGRRGGSRRLAARPARALRRLLLDEPTNDLDFAGLDLLERFLARSEAGIVVVSHDRAFLERTVERVLELEEGTRAAREYAGGFAEYERLRRLERERQSAAYGQYDERRGELEDAFRRAAGPGGERGPGGEPPAEEGAVATDAVGRAEARGARTGRQAVGGVGPADGVAPAARGGDVVARLDGAVVERGAFRLGPVDLELGWASAWPSSGRTAAGRRRSSTRCSGACRSRPATRGSVPASSSASSSRAAPRSRARAAARRLRAAHRPRCPRRRGRCSRSSGSAPTHVARPGGSLSPGERTRAALALLAARGVNCLVLDEPTNHLDLPRSSSSSARSRATTGTLLLVTHDRRFLEAVAPTRTVDVSSFSGPPDLVHRHVRAGRVRGQTPAVAPRDGAALNEGVSRCQAPSRVCDGSVTSSARVRHRPWQSPRGKPPSRAATSAAPTTRSRRPA